MSNVKKVQSPNKKQKDVKQSNQNGFHFGRNLGTLLIILGGIIVLFLAIYIPTSYISAKNKGNVTPFKSGSAPSNVNLTNAIYMDGKDFDVFDLKFACTDISKDQDKMYFTYEFKWNKDKAPAANLRPDASNKTLFVSLCLASDWLGYCNYDSTSVQSYTFSNTTNVTTKTRSITGISKSHGYVNVFPIPVKVKAPTAYLYVSFNYDEAGDTINKTYVLKYTYKEYSKTALGAL